MLTLATRINPDLAKRSFPELVDGTVDVLNKADYIVEETPENQVKWLEEMGRQLGGWGEFGNFSVTLEANILWKVWKVWEARNPESVDGVYLSLEAKARWGGDFYAWAKAFSKRHANEPARITIDNKISVFRDWEGESVIKLPEKVKIPRRDEKGKVITENGETIMDEVDFDPSVVDYSKKLVARKAARQGQLTEETWSVLADPGSTVEEVKLRIQKDRLKLGVNLPDNNEGELKLQFNVFQEQNILYVTSEGKTVALFTPVLENSKDSLWMRGVGYVLGCLGLQVSPEYEVKSKVEQLPLATISDEGLIISVGKGQQLGQLTIEEAKQIYSILGQYFTDKSNNGNNGYYNHTAVDALTKDEADAW